ncbi:MAG: glycosyltransferase [bacterium]
MQKKIVFVLPSLVKHGAENVLVTILQYLNRERFEPVLLYFDSQNNFGNSIPSDIKIRSLQKRNKSDNVRIFFRLSKVLREENPDLICSFITYANYLCLMAKSYCRINAPLIISERTKLSLALPLEQYITIKQMLIRRYYPKANGVICISQGVYQDLISYAGIKPDQGKVIYNPVDIDKIKNLAQESVDHPWVNEYIPVLVACGRLVPQKNYPLLLNAFKLVSQSMPVRLMILGEGALRNNLVATAATLGISENVSFLGYQQNPYKYMARAKGFVLSSSIEGFGNVISEAMACGTPVISTRCNSGPDEIISDGINGILVPGNDVPAMAAAIKRLLSTPTLQTELAKEGKKRVADFSVDKIIAEYEKYFLSFI